LEYGNHKIILAGDAEKSTEESLMKLERKMNLSVLKVAHHGSKSSTSSEFVKHFRPRISVISAGRNNWFGHPHPQVLRNLRKSHSFILRTDMEGTIRISMDRQTISIDTFID
jgi:competence protein ComEC